MRNYLAEHRGPFAMDRLRRPESFEDVCAEGLFRSATPTQILSGRGALFEVGLPGLLGAGGFRPQKIPTKEEVLQAGANIFDATTCTEQVDVFVSHRCDSSRWAKYLALCLHLNMTAAAACSVLVWLSATVIMVTCAGGVDGLGGNMWLLPILVYLPMAVFLIVFFFGHNALSFFRPMSIWVDRACIHQTDHDLKLRQIQALPVFVARSSSMLVLWDDAYFERLWCKLELATFAKYGGAKKVCFLPLGLAPWLLSALALDLILATLLYLSYNELLLEVLSSMAHALIPQRVWDSMAAYSDLVTGVLIIVMLGTFLGILGSIPWTISCRLKLRNHSLMLDQMAAFDCRNARCTVESDRDLVEHQVRRLFHLASGREEEEGTAAPNAERFTPLDAFNEHIRGPLRSAVLESIGEELQVPYGVCLIAGLPMMFYSGVDTLACDSECRGRIGYASVVQYLVANIICYGTSLLLVFPIFYPVFLRMLKRALSVSSELLQPILAGLSGVLTFSYGFSLFAVLWVLSYACVADGVAGLVAYLLFVMLLVGQLYCLFGSGRTSATHPSASLGEGSYRLLQVAGP